MLFCRYTSYVNTLPAVWHASCACECFRRTVRIRRLPSVTCDTSVFLIFFPAKDSSLLQHLFPHLHDEAGATVKKTMFYNKFFPTAVSSFCGGSCVYLFSLCTPPPNTSWHHRFIVCSLLLSLFIVMSLLCCYVVQYVHTSLTTDTKYQHEPFQCYFVVTLLEFLRFIVNTLPALWHAACLCKSTGKLCAFVG